jgi:O-antigen/teichoic acid export membrane protein
LSLLFLLPDLVKIKIDRQVIAQVSQRHSKMARWMLGNMLVAWFSESGFVLMVIGAVGGPAEVGAVRAVQNLILVVNLLIQSLENFVPSSASKKLVSGGPQSLAAYLTKVGGLGAAAILFIAVGLMVFATPIMNLVYNHSFPNQVLILGIFGVFFAMGIVNAVVYAGLRALEHLYSAFLLHLSVGVFCVALTGFASHAFGVLGALGVMLIARLFLTSQIVLVFQLRIRSLSQGAPS